jgi:putative ABC transport system substrate-binding protein
MFYGATSARIWQSAARLVDKILRGPKPSDRVEQPTKIELVVNLRAARGMGLTIPQSILAHADEIIE